MSRVVRSSYTERRGDDYSSDDDRSTYSRSRPGVGSYRTVQRYRVTPSRVEEVEDDRRSSRLEVSDRRGDRLEVDRRVERFTEGPERPRSAIDIRPRSTVVERYVEREPLREPERERERTRTIVYERDRPREPESSRGGGGWERDRDRDPRRPWESERDVRETDVRIEKRTTERREEPYELERYQRETEYYDRPEPPPQPIVIRQRAPEPQQIIVQEAPPPPPIVLPAPQEQGFEVIRRAEVQEIAPREPRREDDEYYYRRDVREVGPRRDEDFAVARYDRRGPREVSDEDYSDGSDVVVRRRVIRRERSRSGSPHHKRHLAEGALAGAGAAAILANHRDKVGNGPEHRGRQVIGGAALGAIGAEVITRARSRYRDSREDRSRSRSSSRHSHTKLKTALGLAAAGIAAAAAVKYAQNRSRNQEELGRGRSRTRSVSRARSEYDADGNVIASKHQDPKHRASQMAKAGVATAAVAGVVEHFRNKSRKRSGSRSKSRIRTGAEIAASGLAGAAVAGLYENRKAKEDRDVQEEAIKKERRRSRSRARSTSVYSNREVDPELGMVQYGTEPVYTEHQTTTYREHDYDPVYAHGARGSGSRSRSHRRRYSSSDEDRGHRSRSRSRVKDIAGAALGTAGAAIGINEYRKRKERKEAERERRRYEEEAPAPEHYYDYHDDDRYTPSPPHASGGSYYPATNTFAPPPTAPVGGYTEQTTTTTHAPDAPIPQYNPADYAGQPPAPHDPYGYPPPRSGENVSTSTAPPVVNGYSPVSTSTIPVPNGAAVGANNVPYFPPPPTAPLHDPEAHLTPPSSISSSPERPHNKSVMFAPLSPTSSRRLAKIHQDQTKPETYQPPVFDDYDNYDDNVYDDPSATRKRRRKHRRRRNSDPSSDRPNVPSKHRRRLRNASRSPSPDSEVEELPPRFDGDGTPLDRGRSGGNPQTEMVERIVHDVGDVVDGRKSWRDLLKSFTDEAGGSGSGSERRRR